MIPNRQCKFLPLFIILLMVACTSDPVQDEEVNPEVSDVVLSDTLYGDLTEKQQYYQHFIFTVPESFQQYPDSIAQWIIEHEPGGLDFSGWHPDTVSRLKRRLDTFDIIQPFYYADYFEYLQLPEYPYWLSSEANRDSVWTMVFSNDRIGMVNLTHDGGNSEEFNQWVANWRKRSGINFVTDEFYDQNAKKDFQRFLSTINGSEHTMHLTVNHFDTVKLGSFRQSTQYKGLFLVETEKQDGINNLIAGGADFIQLSATENNFGSIPFENWNLSENEREYFDQSTQRILNSKHHLYKNEIKSGIEEQTKSVRLNLLYGSTALINNESQLLPLKPGVKIYSDDKMQLLKKTREENKFRVYTKSIEEHLDNILNEEGTKILFLGDSLSSEFLDRLNQSTPDQNAIVCFSNPANYEALISVPNLVYVSRANERKLDYGIPLQQLTGQLAFNADFVSEDSVVTGIKIDKRKLARTTPEFCGLSADTLRQIDWAVSSAMNGRAFPGCQVLIAKNGCVVYDKSFGYHSYDRVKPVTSESLYDLASLTKVVSTTLTGMKLYEMDAFELEDSLGDYISDTLRKHLPYPSTIRNITFQELFIHKSGMPAGFPIIQYMQYTNDEIGRFDRYFCDIADSVYVTEVAENFFLEDCYQDSMWIKLNQIWLNPSKPYKYSDVNMNTLYFMFRSMIWNDARKYGYVLSEEEKEEKTRNLYVEFLYDTFYRSLGMNRTTYKPLKNFAKNEIVPTENERFWRKQLLHGHVHDPNSALHGGIAGNAGIFSTTNDLAILGEMLLREGEYDGKRYLMAETVRKFTTVQPNSHRGLGFNKPSLNTSAFGCADSAPVETYGHTGFTGTCIWIDPVNDITYVFLSNRVHPTVNNRIYQYGIRGRVHQFAYDASLFQ